MGSSARPPAENSRDALNRLKQVTDPGLGVTQYAYNGLDALTTQTDAKRHVTTYAYVPSFSWLPTPGWNNDPPNK